MLPGQAGNDVSTVKWKWLIISDLRDIAWVK